MLFDGPLEILVLLAWARQLLIFRRDSNNCKFKMRARKCCDSKTTTIGSRWRDGGCRSQRAVATAAAAVAATAVVVAAAATTAAAAATYNKPQRKLSAATDDRRRSTEPFFVARVCRRRCLLNRVLFLHPPICSSILSVVVVFDHCRCVRMKADFFVCDNRR